ncbi:MAG: excinuclease ABC subunit UvrA [Candidatus Pacebacteria bacterium]|nr:excinuclease ABC subunit UvrA [Candidatus Pacearchaeota archaeon]NCQ65730.1 excinuclease ABC subunit UvrA [Candidatus Paceibacterota bacterium]PJC43746.1 MAG: excinuclease ABC subunit UvrA [Candidatus Pacebacteria bacterium CG_4_9_14_0_2_um_filter_34_50]
MSTTDTITITGAREHNLKNISVEIPKNKLIVFTGISGSGKSSLAFDTLYAEGQRRYVESLSSYARQFLGVMHKPEVDQIDGLSPAISIDQKTTSHNPRSTVGTITEIYDYLRLLYAKVGRPHCKICGKEVATQSIDEIVGHILNEIKEKVDGSAVRLMVLSPVVRQKKGEFSGLFETLQKKGYLRARIDDRFYSFDEDLTLIKTNKHDINVLVDRLVVSKKQIRDEKERKTLKSRISQSIEESLKLADGLAITSFIEDDSLNFPENPKKFSDKLYSEKRACNDCGISISEIEPRLFSFNSPQGACETCNGLGALQKIDIEKIVAPSLTLSEGAIIPFARMMSNDTWWSRLVRTAVEKTDYDFRKTPFEEMSEEAQKLLLYGSDEIYRVEGENRFGRQTVIHEQFEGFVKNLERRYNETDSDFIRKEIGAYMHKQVCPNCNGDRLKPEALSVYIDDKNIAQITKLPIKKALEWTKLLSENGMLSKKEKLIGESIIKEIITRLSFLSSVGLNYLNLSREASTLAGGEAQRIRLASQIGTGLTGVLYILDEPTIGLHQRDNHQLIETLKELQLKGNTVIIVEHDRDVMLAADYILDIGPKAGVLGGEIVAKGTPEEILKNKNSLTGKYLSRKKDVIRKKTGKKGRDESRGGFNSERRIVDEDAPITKSSIRITGANHHNLKMLDVDFPLGKLTCITGISGSGKSTLLHDTLYTHLAKHLEKSVKTIPGEIETITVPSEVKRVSLIDQSPIGKTPRSNPATYTKIFDYIRKIYANTRDAQVRGFKAGRFSFNVKSGRCETCQGDGQIKIEMQFLPDVYVTCDVCDGKRYSEETLEVTYKHKNISQVLDMTINEAADFFKSQSTISKKIETLQDVGLGYIKLGQPAPTLSGGEAQRVKLAKELSTKTLDHVVYLLDEPTTGLHFEDVNKLLEVLSQLVEQNNTVILIEHNLDVIKNSDWIIDLGPEGGEGGGEIIATGTPHDIANNKNSITGEYLKKELKESGLNSTLE